MEKKRCKVCGNELGPKSGKGLCRRCYAKKDWKENKEKRRRQKYIWYTKNRKRILEQNKLWKDEHPLCNKIYFKNHLKQYPWYSSFHNSKNRCLNKKHKAYKRYGGRGIKFLITKQEFAYLWKRDGAILMETPSIDRIDNNGNYELSNCRFIERNENSRRGSLEKERIRREANYAKD